MNEYINLTLENIDEEHICCAIGDKKHQAGVDSKKEWIKSKLKDGHIFRKLNARGKIFIEYEPIETAWIPISGKNYEYIYCLWVAGSFKGKGIGKELLEYAINDSKEKGKSGICTLVSKKKKPFIGEKKFFEHYGFKVVDIIGDYELLALQFDDSETPRFNDNARTMKIDNQDFTIYYSNECPYVEYEVNELTEYAKENNIEADLFLGIESGINDLLGRWMITNIAVIEDDKDFESYGTSPSFPVPDNLVQKVLDTNLSVAMDTVLGEDKERHNHSGGIQLLTHNEISRIDLTEYAFIMALTKYINGEKWR